MNSPAELLARAVLYEGYILYPYRPSALKNRHRFTPGGLAPKAVAETCGEPWFLRTELLVTGDEETELSVQVRFLHPLTRTAGGPLRQEAIEREMRVPVVRLGELVTARAIDFAFPASQSAERVQQALEATVDLFVVKLTQSVFRVTVRVGNRTPCASTADRDKVALRTLNAAHVALHVRGGALVSLTDPPAELREAANHCHNEGVWPVLVGEPGSRDSMLASPIILPDYPQIAPESAGDFFDGTEIDEMLALRVLTLTDAEKCEVATDPRARAILERVESFPEERMRQLHGATRSPRALRVGDRVRLRPRRRADVIDELLAGKLATVVSVEVDFEGSTHLAVTVAGDPGDDLGAAGQVGHRFFFRPDEVELVAGDES
jgi:hypothetical protein